MEYMLIFHETAADFATRADPAASPAYFGAWMAYIGALHGSGIVVSGAGLQGPDTATTVRVRSGKRQVQDGPFADTHEHLGGFFVIKVGSLDEALEWAARAPCAATGRTEVRPVMAPPPQ
ncbi:MAG TPA: YciI family protein [Ramlibacter sp.]|nr:YciI family protein [Ramlibacter sp.]